MSLRDAYIFSMRAAQRKAEKEATMANKPISTPNVTMGKPRAPDGSPDSKGVPKNITFGTLPPRDPSDSGPTETTGSEAARSRPITFGEPHPPTAPKTEPKPFIPGPLDGKLAEKKPVAKPAKVYPDIRERMEALRSALGDKYPHNDVTVLPEGLKVAVPGGAITIESEKVAKCADNAELRAYIDSLPVL